MLSSHDFIPNDFTMKVRMIMMMEHILKLSSEEEFKNVKCQYHTHEFGAYKEQSQIRLPYYDF